MEVFNQRLEQEYGAEVIVTAPSVPYKSIRELIIPFDQFLWKFHLFTLRFRIQLSSGAKRILKGTVAER